MLYPDSRVHGANIWSTWDRRWCKEDHEYGYALSVAIVWEICDDLSPWENIYNLSFNIRAYDLTRLSLRRVVRIFVSFINFQAVNLSYRISSFVRLYLSKDVGFHKLVIGDIITDITRKGCIFLSKATYNICIDSMLGHNRQHYMVTQ